MTNVDFLTGIPDKLAYACRLARKACGASGKVVLLAADEAQAAQLDEALWTFSETDFVPHVMAGDALAAQTPIIVTASMSAPLPHTEVLVNLGQSMPDGVDRFARVIEIVSTDEQDEQEGRKRYAAYKKQSYPLTHNKVAGQS